MTTPLAIRLRALPRSLTFCQTRNYSRPMLGGKNVIVMPACNAEKTLLKPYEQAAGTVH